MGSIIVVLRSFASIPTLSGKPQPSNKKPLTEKSYFLVSGQAETLTGLDCLQIFCMPQKKTMPILFPTTC